MRDSVGPGNFFVLNRTASKNEINLNSAPFETNEDSSFGRFKIFGRVSLIFQYKTLEMFVPYSISVV